MKLKCIGGHNDGEYHEVYERKVNDGWRIMRHKQYNISTKPIDFSNVEQLKTTIEYEEYVIAVTC